MKKEKELSDEEKAIRKRKQKHQEEAHVWDKGWQLNLKGEVLNLREMFPLFKCEILPKESRIKRGLFKESKGVWVECVEHTPHWHVSG